jgi:ribosome-associated protein
MFIPNAPINQLKLFLEMNFTRADLQKEITYKTSRSGGKGGQNVNKVASKVELLFDIQSSCLFNEDEKALITGKLQNRFNKDGWVQVISEEERSQYLNKERAVDKLMNLLVQSLHRPKVRKAAKISKAAHAKRMDQKRMQSVKKQLRRSSGTLD